MIYRAVVLLSGGIDSTTCLALAVERYGADKVLGVFVHYGQKHEKEYESATKVASHYGVALIEHDMSSVFKLSDCSLLKGNKAIEHGSYHDQLEQTGGEGTVETYVPFRNGLFLSAAATIGISVGAEVVMYGAHADDAAGRAYPDCTPEFEKAMHEAIYEGSGRTLHMETPLLNMTKAEVVALGLKLGAPYKYTWSCYEGEDRPCGTCGTCIDRARAFELNGVKDPAID